MPFSEDPGSIPCLSSISVIRWIITLERMAHATCPAEKFLAWSLPSLLWSCSLSSMTSAHQHNLRQHIHFAFSPPQSRESCRAGLAAPRHPDRGFLCVTSHPQYTAAAVHNHLRRLFLHVLPAWLHLVSYWLSPARRPIGSRAPCCHLSETRMQRAEERGQFWDVSVG